MDSSTHNALQGCVASLQSSMQLLESSINILDSGVSDYPRLTKVLQTTRHFELVSENELVTAQSSLLSEIQPEVSVLLSRVETYLDKLERREQSLIAKAELQEGRLSQPSRSGTQANSAAKSRICHPLNLDLISFHCMATSIRTCLHSSLKVQRALSLQPQCLTTTISQRRSLRTKPQVTKSSVPDYAFAFDIDGVLLREATPIPGARDALLRLQREKIPFILLTNGGGKSEPERVADLSSRLDVELDTGMFVQSHTPFGEYGHYKEGTVLVVGGDYDKCQRVAKENYGFQKVVTPGDIICAYPDIWPFAKVFADYYKQFAKPLPKPIIPGAQGDETLKIDAIFVYNDPRDWGLDSTIILDLLLSSQGRLGTLSPKNNDPSLPNSGFLQDGQPNLYYSNPDLWWASSYHLPRLGQGGFREAFRGLWTAATNGAELKQTIIGKPYQSTYEFAEQRLRQHRKRLFGSTGLNDPLRKVYMVGDNPESDIRGANGYRSPYGSLWSSLLVKTGVYREGNVPSCEPTVITKDVGEAVEWAIEDAKKMT
ncbi:Hypothetical protein R9X50_00466300 [Acrodontium crateriforme]|uniref:DASH complex subunit SPC19 n=1 Tax=Acrodontium crateriforme TaxID=150365 RepID=A0AAQ3M5S0_9PEZI|nr:Hypothetical protein R9X50_00466300 [Acrodontium crateriforme]